MTNDLLVVVCDIEPKKEIFMFCISCSLGMICCGLTEI